MMVQTVLVGVRAVSGGGGWCSVFSGDQASAPSPHQHAMLVSAHSVIQYSSFSFWWDMNVNGDNSDEWSVSPVVWWSPCWAESMSGVTPMISSDSSGLSYSGAVTLLKTLEKTRLVDQIQSGAVECWGDTSSSETIIIALTQLRPNIEYHSQDLSQYCGSSRVIVCESGTNIMKSVFMCVHVMIWWG